MGLLIAAGVLTLLAVMPVGVRVRYDEDGFYLKLLIGPLSVTLFPREKKEKKKGAPAKKSTSTTKKSAQTPNRQKKGGSLTEFQGIITQALAFLGEFRRRLIIKRLELKLTLAADDPCDLACNYGRAWAALGNLMPLLENVFIIKKRDVGINCDFTQTRTTVFACVDVVISIGRLLWLLVVYGIRILTEYLKLKNLRKGGNSL